MKTLSKDLFQIRSNMYVVKLQPEINTYSSLIYLDLAMDLDKKYCYNVSANKMISIFYQNFRWNRWKLPVILPTSYDENECQKRQENDIWLDNRVQFDCDRCLIT